MEEIPDILQSGRCTSTKVSMNNSAPPPFRTFFPPHPQLLQLVREDSGRSAHCNSLHVEKGPYREPGFWEGPPVKAREGRAETGKRSLPST